MQLSTVLALFAAVAAVSAAPSPQAEDSSSSSQGPSCNNGKVQCCSQLQNPKESSKTLASLGLEGIAGLVGADCDQVPVIAGAVQNTCKSTPVCCSGSAKNGLLQLGCNPIAVN